MGVLSLYKLNAKQFSPKEKHDNFQRVSMEHKAKKEKFLFTLLEALLLILKV